MQTIRIESEINFMSIDELWFNYTPPDNGAQEEIEIDLIFIHNRCLSPEARDILMSVPGILYDPKMAGYKKELMTIGEILWFKCKDYLIQTELDK